jgi:serine/threonine-protein kinase
MVLEFCAGGDLEDYLRQGALSDSISADFMSQVMAGIAHVHRAGIVHCDVKPGNVLLQLSAEGTSVLKLSDFGLARSCGVPMVVVWVFRWRSLRRLASGNL